MTGVIMTLLGSTAIAAAIFGGGLAVKTYRHRHRRARVGMALALAGAVEALLRLIETRNVGSKLRRMLADLEAGRDIRSGPIIGDNVLLRTIFDAYAGALGTHGGDQPFHVVRFVTHSYGVQLDMLRLAGDRDDVEIKAEIIRELDGLWSEITARGEDLVRNLRQVGGLRSPTAAGRSGHLACT